MSLSASVCSRLQHQQETIQELLNGFSEEQLRQRIQKEKWSAFKQVVHLAERSTVTTITDSSYDMKRITYLAYLC